MRASFPIKKEQIRFIGFISLRESNLGRKIKKHYKLFKAAVRREAGWEEQTFARKKIGRNDSCPCGSGKKYKMCCRR